MTLYPQNLAQSLGVPEDELVVVRDAPLTGGVRNRVSEEAIEPSEAPELLNVDLDDPTEPKKRDGYTRAPVGTTGLASATLRGSLLDEMDLGISSRMLVAAFPDPDNGGVYVATHPDNSSGWTEARVKFEPGGEADRSLDVDTKQAAFVQGNKLGWLFPSAQRNAHMMEISGQLTDLGNENGSPPRGVVDAVYILNRIFVFYGDSLGWSKILPSKGDLYPTPAAFDRTNNRLVLSPERGAQPVALRKWRRQVLIAFFRNHIEEVIIDPSNPIDSTRNDLEPRFGCGARNSIIQIGDELYFLDQECQYRALRIDQQGTLRGIIPLPVSESIREEIGPKGQINRAHAGKTWAVRLGEFIDICYPRGSSTEPNAVMRYNTALRYWTGPWVFNRPLGQGLASDIRGGGYELFTLDGSASDPQSRLYRMYDGSYSDDGTAIQYRETSKFYYLGFPETDKEIKYVDLEVDGDLGATGSLSVRTSLNDDFTSLATRDVLAKTQGSYPLDGTGGEQYSLAAADYPLTATTKKRSTKKLVVSEQDGAFKGRGFQWRLSNSDDVKQFSRAGLRTALRVRNVQKDEEP